MNYDEIERLLIDREYRELAQLGAAAIPHLIAALKDKDARVRIKAAVAVEVLAGNPHNVEVIGFVPVLIDALKDEDWEMREMATRLLGDIAEKIAQRETKPEIIREELGELVASVKRNGHAAEAIRIEKVAARAYIKMCAIRSKDAATKHLLAGDGVMLMGERPKPPSGKGMYRTGREARAFA